MLFPFRKGTPPETTLTGLPQVCASMQEKVCLEGMGEKGLFELKIGKLGSVAIRFQD
jgi:hypothetical protein